MEVMDFARLTSTAGRSKQDLSVLTFLQVCASIYRAVYVYMSIYNTCAYSSVDISVC